MWMTWKAAVVNHPFRRRRGGRRLRSGEDVGSARLEEPDPPVHMGDIAGSSVPDVDIPAPDVATEPPGDGLDHGYDSASGKDHAVPGVVTGKPLGIGGSTAALKATGQWRPVTVAAKAAKRVGFSVAGVPRTSMSGRRATWVRRPPAKFAQGRGLRGYSHFRCGRGAV